MKLTIPHGTMPIKSLTVHCVGYAKLTTMLEQYWFFYCCFCSTAL